MPKPRGSKNRKLKPVLHIFCEGEKTEPGYLNGYLGKFHANNRRLQVIRVEKTRKNTPKQLVEEALKLKKDRMTPDHDAFWVVYDREGKDKYSDKLHKEALVKASSGGIEVALTNVCFEVWLILHFSELTASYSCYSDLMKNSVLKAELGKLGIKEYDKAIEGLFELVSDKIELARSRARKMNRATLDASYDTEHNPHLLNPYTGFHHLLDAIDRFVKNS